MLFYTRCICRKYTKKKETPPSILRKIGRIAYSGNYSDTPFSQYYPGNVKLSFYSSISKGCHAIAM
jgi:hypothetical protein